MVYNAEVNHKIIIMVKLNMVKLKLHLNQTSSFLIFFFNYLPDYYQSMFKTHVSFKLYLIWWTRSQGTSDLWADRSPSRERTPQQITWLWDEGTGGPLMGGDWSTHGRGPLTGADTPLIQSEAREMDQNEGTGPLPVRSRSAPESRPPCDLSKPIRGQKIRGPVRSFKISNFRQQ